QAERKVNGEEERGEEGMGQEGEDDERDGEDKEGDDDNSGSNKQRETERLTKIQKACLHFCIALMGQSVTRREHDSALVCALAVLGVKQDGWKGAEQYPSVLSVMIKVARFMPFEEDEFGGDGAYESDGSAKTSRLGKKGCLQLVARMMDRFKVRGSHGPMQWMLDLRTYGLKIHYNTTSRGHAECKGHDEVIHGSVTRSPRLLIGKHAHEIPGIPWQSLRDNPTDEQPGWNFLHNHRSRLLVDGQM
ncbi:hypothetical protein LTR66_001501, partial [Elasticomyces elasticus]